MLVYRLLRERSTGYRIILLISSSSHCHTLQAIRSLWGTRLASTVCGTGSEPAELGGTGYAINTGASMQIGITPLFSDLRIDVVLVCLEMRGSTNYSVGG